MFTLKLVAGLQLEMDLAWAFNPFNMRFGASHIESEGTNVRPLTGSTDRDGYRNTGLNLKGKLSIQCANRTIVYQSLYKRNGGI